MTLRARNAVLQSRIGMYKLLLAIVTVWAMSATIGWMNVQRQIDVNVRPSLPNTNIVLGHDGVDHAAAFQFAAFVLQSVYNWEDNGEQDYLLNIRYLRENRLISQSMYEYFRQDAFQRLGRSGGVNTLSNRERSDNVPKEFYFKADYVIPRDDFYIVNVVMDSEERLNDRVVRDVRFQYYLKVGRTSEADNNDYKLQVLGFYNMNAPRRINDNMQTAQAGQ